MRSLIAVLLLLISTGLFAQKKGKTRDPLAGVDTALQRVLKDRKAAGFAVAVVKNKEVIYAKGFGYRDYEKKLPVTPQTLFAIGSCTKAFTASLIGLLQHDGKVEYDKPVQQYLPELQFYNDELNNHVTLRDMMCHRTGLPRHDYSWYLFRSSSRDSLIRRIKFQEPTAAIRQTWQYNNFMFLGLGMVEQKLTGRSWENNIREKIFQPLDMKLSNFSIKDMEQSDNASLGYQLYQDSIIRKTEYFNIDAMGPAGSINSNVTEMANWVIAWINGGQFGGTEVLPFVYTSEATSSQMVANAGLPDKELPDAFFGNYGFGWFLSNYRGHYRAEHGGNINGFSASTSFFPTDSIGIIVLSNQNGSAVPGIVRNLIADRLLGLKQINWNSKANEAEAKARKSSEEAKKNMTDNRVSGTHPSHDLKDYEGLYHNDGYGTLEVVLKDDSLIMLTPPDERTWLRHYHYDIFQPFGINRIYGIDTSENNPNKIQFLMSPSGEIDKVALPLQPGLDDIVFARKAKPKPVSREELEKFVGEYQFAPGRTAKFYIKGENTLYAFVPGQPEYELVPTEKNMFAFEKLRGFSVEFEENNTGAVIAVKFIQPNGTFRAEKKK